MLVPSRGRLATSLQLQPDQQLCTGLEPLPDSKRTELWRSPPRTGTRSLALSTPNWNSFSGALHPELELSWNSFLGVSARPFIGFGGGVWSFTFDPSPPAGSAPFVILIRSQVMRGRGRNHPHNADVFGIIIRCRGSIAFVCGDVVRWGRRCWRKDGGAMEMMVRRCCTFVEMMARRCCSFVEMMVFKITIRKNNTTSRFTARHTNNAL